MNGKNLQLLGIERSAGWQPDIHETICALQAELGRGEAVYTRDELDRLARKLADYEFMLQRMIST
jgi:hypothetical protein